MARGTHRHTQEASGQLRQWLQQQGIDRDSLFNWGTSRMWDQVNEIYINPRSFRMALQRFMMDGGGLNAPARELIQHIAHSILAGRTLPRPADNGTVEITPDLVSDSWHAPLAVAPCPTCGQNARVRLNSDGTWEFVGVHPDSTEEV